MIEIILTYTGLCTAGCIFLFLLAPLPVHAASADLHVRATIVDPVAARDRYHLAFERCMETPHRSRLLETDAGLQALSRECCKMSRPHTLWDDECLQAHSAQ